MKRRKYLLSNVRFVDVFLFSLCIFLSTVEAGRVWTLKGEEDFQKGEIEGLSVLSSGEMVLAPLINDLPGLTANFIWDIQFCQDTGRILAATGAPGAAYQIEDGEVSLLHKTNEDHATSILPMPDGSFLLATAPRGIIYKISKDHGVTVFANLDVNYVWEMAWGDNGNIYCATGPEGQLLSLTEEGEVSVLFQASPSNLLAMAVHPETGKFYVGTQPAGLVYEIDEKGDHTIIFDADEEEIRDILIADDGALYIATAQGERAQRHQEQSPEPDGSAQVDTPRSGPYTNMLPGRPQAPNSIYRIDLRTGAYRYARFGDELALSLASWRNGEEILVGTGVEGRLIGIENGGRTRVLADTGARHISALLSTDNEKVIAGTSNPGRIMEINPDYANKGTYNSEVFDAEYLSRWGSLHWLASEPENTAIQVYVRTGNSREPDQTWSAWMGPAEDATGTHLDVKNARFAQVRIVLTSHDPQETPKLNKLSLNYRQSNRRPVIENLNLADEEKNAGNSTKNISWNASDPNQDELESAVYYRGVEERDWKELKTGIVNNNSYRWDTERVPAGHYFVKLIVTDRPSRGPMEALQDEKVLAPFLIDNCTPRIEGLDYTERLAEHKYIITGIASDTTSRIKSIKLSHNAAEWEPVFPDDGIFDSREEEFTHTTPELDAGEHVFVFIAEDSAGNTASGKVIIDTEAR